MRHSIHVNKNATRSKYQWLFRAYPTDLKTIRKEERKKSAGKTFFLPISICHGERLEKHLFHNASKYQNLSRSTVGIIVIFEPRRLKNITLKILTKNTPISTNVKIDAPANRPKLPPISDKNSSNFFSMLMFLIVKKLQSDFNQMLVLLRVLDFVPLCNCSSSRFVSSSLRCSTK